jgi:xanthine/uracil/vitamin C permease (AzgA family)
MSARLLTLVLAFLIGVSAAILLIVLGSVGVTGSIFIGLLITVALGAFLKWALFRPLPPIENGRLQDD